MSWCHTTSQLASGDLSNSVARNGKASQPRISRAISTKRELRASASTSAFDIRSRIPARLRRNEVASNFRRVDETSSRLRTSETIANPSLSTGVRTIMLSLHHIDFRQSKRSAALAARLGTARSATPGRRAPFSGVGLRARRLNCLPPKTPQSFLKNRGTWIHLCRYPAFVLRANFMRAAQITALSSRLQFD